MTYRLSRLSVFRGVIVVEGLSSCGAPFIVYHDPAITLTQTATCEPSETGGEHAFRSCAIATSVEIEHDRIELVFPDGAHVRNAAADALAADDNAYRAMFERFRHETVRGGRLLEIGSRARSGNVHRHLFSDAVDYVGLDIKDGPNVDVVGDAHELRSLLRGQFDLAFSTAVFEHLLMPWKVAVELGHVLKRDGVALIASHAAFPLHEEPWDFWRYSKNAWRGLFNAHSGFQVLDAQYSVKCSIATDFAPGGPLQGIDLCANYILSACLVKKVGEPQVDWVRSPSEVYDLAYSH